MRAHDRALTTTEQDFEGGNPNLDRGLVREKRDFDDGRCKASADGLLPEEIVSV